MDISGLFRDRLSAEETDSPDAVTSVFPLLTLWACARISTRRMKKIRTISSPVTAHPADSAARVCRKTLETEALPAELPEETDEDGSGNIGSELHSQRLFPENTRRVFAKRKAQSARYSYMEDRSC